MRSAELAATPANEAAADRAAKQDGEIAAAARLDKTPAHLAAGRDGHRCELLIAFALIAFEPLRRESHAELLRKRLRSNSRGPSFLRLTSRPGRCAIAIADLLSEDAILVARFMLQCLPRDAAERVMRGAASKAYCVGVRSLSCFNYREGRRW